MGKARSADAGTNNRDRSRGGSSGDGFDDIFDSNIVEGQLKGLRGELAGIKFDLANLVGQLGALGASGGLDQSSESIKRLIVEGVVTLRRAIKGLSQEVQALKPEESAAGRTPDAPVPAATDLSPQLKAHLDGIESRLGGLMRPNDVESAAAPSLRGELQDLERRLQAEQEWRKQLPEEITKVARELFLADRATLLKGLLHRLPDLFDLVHDAWSFWDANEKLTPDESAARVHVLPVFEGLKADMEDWQKRLGFSQEDPMAGASPGTVPFDDWQHERVGIKRSEGDEEVQTIEKVLFVGYRWHDEWLRKPKVIVRIPREKPRRAATAPVASVEIPPRSDAADQGLNPGEAPPS